MVKWDSSSIKEETKGRHRLEMHPNTPQNPAYCRAGVLVSPGSEGLSRAPEMGALPHKRRLDIWCTKEWMPLRTISWPGLYGNMGN